MKLPNLLTKTKSFVLITIALASLCMMLAYPFIHNSASVVTPNTTIDPSEELYDIVFSSTLPRYYELMKKQTPEVQPYEVFLKEPSEETIRTLGQPITDAIHDQLLYLKENYSLISYYVYDQKTNAYITNAEANLDILKDIGTKGDPVYAWYLSFSFDDNGIISIQASTPNDHSASWFSSQYQSATRALFSSSNMRLYTEYDDSGVYSIYFDEIKDSQLQTPKNTTFVFALTQDEMSKLFSIDNQSSSYDSYFYQEAIIPYYFLIFAGIALCIFLRFKADPMELPLYRWFKKIPMEVHAFLLFMTLPLVSEIGGLIVQSTVENQHIFLIHGNANSLFGYIYLLVFENYLLWFLGFTYITYFIIAFKDMWKRNAWREYFATRRFLHWCRVKWHNTLDFAKQIDLTENDDKRIFVALSINFVVLSFFIMMWGFGLFFLLVYSLFLFVFAKKYMKSIRHDYANLLDATKHIAGGNLDNDIETDLGVFNDFKDHMVDIRAGFKQAVEEEVHSQRMKTELITNVSHDLKTPLTSIITYIDLLKNDDLSESERKKYMETLDRNSIRLKHLIEDLFEVSKANSGTMNLDCMNMDIVSLMKQVQVELDGQLSKKKLRIKNNFSDEKIICYLDSQKTYRIFENLVGNIAKYAMKQTRVYVDITDYDNRVDIVLRNISAVEMDFDPEDITDRFTRGDASRNTEGSGLGLAIAKSFTELQGGTLRISIDGDLFKVHLCFPKQTQE